MNQPDCVFCKIARGEVPSYKVYEDEKTFAFLDISPVSSGHVLVIPKKHATDIFEIEESEWNAVMKTARTIAHTLEKAFAPQGINLVMNNRALAGQAVFHAHVHVVPRSEDDRYKSWLGKSFSESEGREIAEKIRAAL